MPISQSYWMCPKGHRITFPFGIDPLQILEAVKMHAAVCESLPAEASSADGPAVSAHPGCRAEYCARELNGKYHILRGGRIIARDIDPALAYVITALLNGQEAATIADLYRQCEELANRLEHSNAINTENRDYIATLEHSNTEFEKKLELLTRQKASAKGRLARQRMNANA